jgi:anthranilate phosphoribosyltransferase
VAEGVLDPTAVGLAPVPLADLVGGDAAANAVVARAVLAGEPGPVRDAVLLNAAAALTAAAPTADGSLADRVAEALLPAAEAIDSGAAAKLLDTWAVRSTELAAAP